MSSVTNRKGLNPQDRLRQLLAAVLQQLSTCHILINAIHQPHRPHSAPWWFNRVGNKPSVKADLAIYSYVLGISRQGYKFNNQQ